VKKPSTGSEITASGIQVSIQVRHNSFLCYVSECGLTRVSSVC